MERRRSLGVKMEGLIEQEVAPVCPGHRRSPPPLPPTTWEDLMGRHLMVLMGGCDVCAERKVLETRSK